MAKSYDVCVIGSGTAGSTVAVKLAKQGKNVAVIDRRPFGGTCALRGCNPKKVLVSAAEAVDRCRRMDGKGIGGDTSLIWSDLIDYKNSLVDDIPSSTEKKYDSAGIDSYHGAARFAAENRIAVNDDVIEAEFIVVASGSQPVRLPVEGFEHAVMSDTFMRTPSLPAKIVCMGGGFIAFEFAHVAARAGVEVDILEEGDRPLRGFDPELVAMLVEASRERGIGVHTNSPVQAIEKRSGEYLVSTGGNGSRTFECGLVLHGAGRVPAIEELAPEKGNVVVEDAAISLDEFLRSTTNTGVFVAGDANGNSPQLTPVAEHEGDVVVHNILNGVSRKPDYTAVPAVVYTYPQLAMTGETESSARRKGMDVDTVFEDTSSWADNKRLNLSTSGCKLVLDKRGGRLVGAHMLGHNVDEVINLFTLAIRHNLSVEELRRTLLVFPSVSYGIKHLLRGV